ncbi:MAG: DUF424 family protein [Candidatus Lokiarchaeota archaeon]|nr:DUF424 family protein [Candidatus Lokiarchaeota archaeon]
MNVYLKIHHNNEIETVACCDEPLLKKVFKEDNSRIEITEQFFSGALMDIDDAIEILMHAQYFNIVGKNIIEKAISHNILPKEGVRTINGVPMAMKMMF